MEWMYFMNAGVSVAETSTVLHQSPLRSSWRSGRCRRSSTWGRRRPRWSRGAPSWGSCAWPAGWGGGAGARPRPAGRPGCPCRQCTLAPTRSPSQGGTRAASAGTESKGAGWFYWDMLTPYCLSLLFILEWCDLVCRWLRWSLDMLGKPQKLWNTKL